MTTLGSYAVEGVLFATHNIGLARASAELIYSIRKDAEGASEVQKLEVTPSLSVFLGELSFSGYRELGFDKILLVEGSTEVKMIQQFLRKYGRDHQIVLLPLGGSQLIKESSEAELLEIKRICENVSALIDSERTALEAAIEPSRAAFVETCQNADIDCHVLERRAIENYLSDRAMFLLSLEKRKLKYIGGVAKNCKVIIEIEANKPEKIRLDKLAESLPVGDFAPIQLNLDKPKTVWVATVEVELPQLEGTRTIAIVMNASTFDSSSDIDYLITNVDGSTATAEWIVTTYTQRN